MGADIRFQQEMNLLHVRYQSVYKRVDAQLLSRPTLLAALYLKDALRVSMSCAGSAAIGVPALWFWGAMSDFATIQNALSVPVNSAELWSQSQSLFTVVFVLLLGLSVFRGEFGRSRRARVHADTELLFAGERSGACLTSDIEQSTKPSGEGGTTSAATTK